MALINHLLSRFHLKLVHAEHAFHIAYLSAIIGNFEHFHRYAAAGLLIVIALMLIFHADSE